MKIRELEDFQDSRDKWNALLRSSLLGNNVFLTWEWLSTWWKHFGESRKPLILIVEDRSEVMAIAPLMLSKYKAPAYGSIKKIEFLGTRHSDYNNFIILKREAECVRLIVDYLTNTVADWDWIELKEIPESIERGNFTKTLFADMPHGLKVKSRVCNICPYTILPNSYDVLMKELNRKLKENLKRRLKRIKERYSVELKRYDEFGFSTNEALEVFIELNEKRWGRAREPGFRTFHRDVAKLFADAGWLGLYFLALDGEPVSSEYTFEYGEKIYSYLGGWDPRYSGYSVGSVLTMFLLKRFIEKGFKEYDMMRGNELYKTTWTRSYRRNFEIRLVREHLLPGFYEWFTWNETANNLAQKLKISLTKSHV